jgi:hypothetical protein
MPARAVLGVTDDDVDVDRRSTPPLVSFFGELRQAFGSQPWGTRGPPPMFYRLQECQCVVLERPRLPGNPVSMVEWEVQCSITWLNAEPKDHVERDRGRGDQSPTRTRQEAMG